MARGAEMLGLGGSSNTMDGEPQMGDRTAASPPSTSTSASGAGAASVPPARRGWRARLLALRDETYALWLASRDPRTPWYAKAMVGVVVAYAVSPIDLIPDFIPVLGQLDDMLLLPLGIALAIGMVPRAVLEEKRAEAAIRFGGGGPDALAAAVRDRAAATAAVPATRPATSGEKKTP
jgi:uncharacterized membrane protein YkvA (DUF1232 family)